MTPRLLTPLFTVVLFLSPFMLWTQNDRELRPEYDFDYVYKLRMTNKKDHIQFDYYLKKDAGYFGFELPDMAQQKESMGMFTVMDTDKGMSAMFMEVMGKKILKKTKFDLKDFDEDSDASDFEIKPIGSKKILGYDCDGFEMENKEVKLTYYITNEAPVSFSNMWNTGKSKMPKGFNPAWLNKYKDNGLIMEMDYVDKKKNKNNMSMECVGLEETDFSIRSSDYGSMFGALGG